MKTSISILILVVLLITGCSQANPPENKQSMPEDREANVTVPAVEVIADQLNVPWSINKIGNTFFISERTGTIVKVANGTKERQKVLLKKPLATAAEAGLLGFVLTPDFTKTNKAIAYYTYQNQSGQFNRVVELLLDNGQWKDSRILLDNIPSGAFHHGGRLKIGPDGKLYITTGDGAENPETAQDVRSLNGKILRMNLDGTIPADNPFPGSYVYSYGHRNPQGLAWSADGTLYASEHGPSARDEINEVKAGRNYGWPVIAGKQTKAGMESPLFQSGDDTWAPSGMAFYNGKLYAATLRGNAVREFDSKNRTTRKLISGLGRIRDVFIEDGILYFVSNNTDGRGTPGEKDDKLYMVKLQDKK